MYILKKGTVKLFYLADVLKKRVVKDQYFAYEEI